MTTTTFPFSINHHLRAKNLNVEPPRSPYEKIADHVFAARTLDKCRSNLAGTLGEYEFNCKLDRRWFDFTGINVIDFMEFVATGADDDEVDRWIREYSVARERVQIVQWNNQMRELRISELPERSQVYIEDLLSSIVPSGRSPATLFEVFEVDEGRLELG